MKVIVAVPDRERGFDLARALHGEGVLSSCITTCPSVAARRALPPGALVTTIGWIGAGRWVHRHLHLPGRIEPVLDAAFARFVARSLPAESKILMVWRQAALEAIPAAQALGLKVVLIQSAPHIAYRTEVQRRSHKRFDLTAPERASCLVARELAEYDAADAITVPTRFVAETFIRRGLARERVLINPYGADLSHFLALPLRRETQPLRILFVGRVGICTGVPWLLRAFARLDVKAELHLVGPLDPGMDHVLRYEPMAHVTVHGFVPESTLPAQYAAADIFCLPALKEEWPLGILRAMASGVPVVATPETGAADIMRDGIDGRIVPSGNPPALAVALEEMSADPLLRHAMGDRARRAVATGYDWASHGRRAVAACAHLLRPSSDVPHET